MNELNQSQVMQFRRRTTTTTTTMFVQLLITISIQTVFVVLSQNQCALCATTTIGTENVSDNLKHQVQVNGGGDGSGPAAAATVISTDSSLLSKSSLNQKTADLTVLINETLAINNKTSSDKQLVTGIKDDWTFDMVEYDLMEFLQDLNARYKLSNRSQPLDDVIDQKFSSSANKFASDATPDNANDDLSSSIVVTAKSAINQVVEKKEQKLEQKSEVSVEKQNTNLPPPPAAAAAAPINEQVEKVFNKPQETIVKGSIIHPTSIPDLSTSLASLGDQEIAESSWQYGIFDRFTRPRTSSTTTTTQDPYAAADSIDKYDTNSFNSDECGLRTYDMEQPNYYPQMIRLNEQTPLATSSEGEISKDSEVSNLRRQRPLLSSAVILRDKYNQFLSSPSSSNGGFSDRDDSNLRDEMKNISDWPNKQEKDAYDSYNSQNINNQSPALNEWPGSGGLNNHVGSQLTSSDSSSSSSTNGGLAEGEFNLSSRRHWLQQQLSNTLQILGFNVSSQSASEFLNQTSGISLNMRENMMKKSGKFGKSLSPELEKSLSSSPSSDNLQQQQQQQQIPEQKLLARQDDLKLEARVIGGTDARLGDSPWSVSLQALVSRPGTGGVEYRHYCGGTIISERYVLTAAHCLDFMVGRESRLFVVIGDLNWRMSAASLHGRRFGIDKLIIHSGYKSTAFGHDIGLIRTKESMKPLKVNGRYIINSVCLPERNVEHTGEAELVGWGLFSNRNEMADSLQIADVPILPRPLCVDLYRRRTGLIQWLIGIELITDKQVCAGTFGRGICQGDSGSALVYNEKIPKRNGKQISKILRNSQSIRDHQTRATIIGVVAFGGIRRCSYQSLPGVYMQTSKYMDWILPRAQ